MSELEAYEDGEADNLLGRAIADADYDLDEEYYATDEDSNEDEFEGSGGYGHNSDDSLSGQEQGEGYCH